MADKEKRVKLVHREQQAEANPLEEHVAVWLEQGWERATEAKKEGQK